MKQNTYELTNPQKSIWYTEKYYQGTTINNICGLVYIKEKINLKKLKEAINIFIQNNDSYKIRLTQEGSKIVQYFAEDKYYEFETLNIEKEQQIDEIAKKVKNQKFNILNSQLFDFKLFKMPDAEGGYGGFFVLTHHIISDGVTLSFVGTDIIQIYSKLLKNETIEKKPYSYIDFINSEKEYLSSSRFYNDKIYWEEQLSPLPEVASVRIPNGNKLSDSIQAKRKEYTLNADLVKKMNTYCSKYKISMYNFLIGIYSIYFGKANNIDKFTFGTPLLNRINHAERQTSGMFISTSLLKIDISENVPFSEFVKTIAKNNIGMLRHQKYNYDLILENLRKNDSSISKLFDIGLSYQVTKSTISDFEIPYITKWYGNDFIANTLDIHFHDLGDTGNLIIEYDYQISKLNEIAISKIHSRISEIINSVLENETIFINDIDILTKEEKFKITNEFKYTKNFSENLTAIELFEKQVQSNPTQIALSYKSTKLTYLELDKKANQFARFLKEKHNIEKGSVISVCMDRDISFIITILGILKLGCSYLPINPDYPADRISYIVNNSKSKLIISTKKIDLENNIIFKEIKLDKFLDEKIDIKISPSELAYIIYTSGSTGNPKGVMLTHSNLVNFLYSFNNEFKQKFGSNDKCLSLTNISFDVSVSEIFTPLCFGATLVLYEENILTKLSTLTNTIIKNEITFMYISPNILDTLYQSLLKNKNEVKLNKLLVGVESIKNETLNNYYNLNPKIEIVNGYGPTETTICCTFYKYKKTNLQNDTRIVPIGKPLLNNEILILNKWQTVQPVEVPGEIYVSGKNVSKGYLGNTSLTKKSFVKINNKIYYKTGDLGYFDKIGNIHFLGRADFQIKINGYRIELGEITNTIKKIKTVENAHTKVETIHNRPYICAYVVSKTLSADDIKNKLKKYLPYYMIPSFIKIIDYMPLTLNGKIDKDELTIDFTPTSTEATVSPTTDTEKLLYEIFLNLLNLKAMSILDNFFELGADSLTCIKLIAEISNTLHVDLKITDLFKNTTIKSLAKYIEKQSSDNLADIKIGPKQEYYKLSSAQKRIYYSSYAFDNNTILYNMPGGILLNKIPDVEKLESCFNTLIKRHESLRTYIDTVDGIPVQKILKSASLKIDVINASTNNLNVLYNNFVEPFNLQKAPLLRVQLVKFKDKTSLLLFDTHHIICDGASISTLVKELCKLYNNEKLKPIRLSYKDYIFWENENLKNGNFKNSKKYWIKQFENNDIPILTLPYNHTRPAKKTFKGAKVYKTFPNADKIYDFCKHANVTPYMFLLSIYYILLARYSMQDDIVVGSPIIGRQNSKFSELVGMFVNTLPLRMKIDFNSSFEEFLEKTKNMCLNAFEHQLYPLNEIIQDLNITRQLNRNPLFDVLFTYQNNGNPKFDFNDIEAQFFIPDNKTSKFDLSIEVVPENDKFNFTFEYSTSLFKATFMNNLVNHYLNILKNVLDNPKLKICDIDMLSAKEKNKILIDFNQTEMYYPKEKSLIDLFKEQVEENPSNIAVESNGKYLTYKELDEKSNTIALEILKNAKTSDIIGVYMNKSIELVISIWGILKAGCAYMPMFIDYPEDRLNYMIENSKCPLVITNQQNKLNIKTLKINNFEKITPTSFFHSSCNPSDLAYVIYTSGSTGKPKGVKITHKCLNNYVHSFNKLFKTITSEDRFLCSTNISFDVSIWELFMSILNGATLVMYKEEIIHDIVQFSNFIVENGITALYIPPNILEEVFSLLEIKPNIQIEKLLVGVEPIKRKTLYNYYKLNPNITIINGYGPTETTICSTALEITPTNKDEKIVPIGKPIGNTKIYIVDKFLNIVPIGVPGEIVITGDGVGPGYIDNKHETDKNFIANPFNNLSPKLYKTGDIAKWHSSGIISFLARKDTQVKISGYRIELKEIDNWIIKYPSIYKCLTVVNETKNSSYLVTYFTANQKVNVLELTSFIQSKLPFYMIPKAFIQLDYFPLTVNGKIDMKKLPKPKIISETEYAPPQTEMEKFLCKLWSNLFGQKKIGINDNFFNLGGDSLSAIRLQMEALNQNINITYSDIFKYPTIALLAKKAQNSVSEQLDNYKSYDYSKINQLLSYNDVKNIPSKISLNSIGNIFLTGATGFLGSHILDAYFTQNPSGIAYCLLRFKNGKNPKERLKKVLNFYFGNKYDDYFETQIRIVIGDNVKYKFGVDNYYLRKFAKNIDVVINSAALVKHYGDYNDFYSINVIGTKNVIDFCKRYNKKLYHISTSSVSGLGLPENRIRQEKNITYFSEKDLYKNQNLNNTYLQTKFEAEKLIFEEIVNGKLNATVLRLGNVSSRFIDGKFQMNSTENAFVSKLYSVLKLGVLQNGFKKHSTEFAPVDLCAKAIIKLIQSNPKFTIFHVFNTNLVSFTDLVKYINELNIKLDFVTDKEFSDKVSSFLKDPVLKKEISGLVTELDNDKKFKIISNILMDCNFSATYLNKIGFNWPKIDKDYFVKYIEYLRSINYFNF